MHKAYECELLLRETIPKLPQGFLLSDGIFDGFRSVRVDMWVFFGRVFACVCTYVEGVGPWV